MVSFTNFQRDPFSEVIQQIVKKKLNLRKQPLFLSLTSKLAKIVQRV
jgi:hypothetical protein